MSEAFESFEHAGMVCELHQDETPQSPAEWDQLGTLVAFPGLWREYRFAARESTGTEDDAFERGGFALLERYLRMTEDAIAIPFRFEDYGSGGARIRKTSSDDERASGFLVTTPARVAELAREDQSRDQDWIREALTGELREWDAYVSGEVVSYVVRDKAGAIIDSCGGFYPEHFTAEERAAYGRPADDDGLEYVRQEAREAAEWEAEERGRAARQDIATVTS